MGVLGDIVNSIPIIGHAKALVHLLGGDRVEAKKALTAANRLPVALVNGFCSCIHEDGEFDAIDRSITPYQKLATDPSNGRTVTENTRRYNESLWRQGVGRLWKFSGEEIPDAEDRKAFRRGWEKLVKRTKILQLKTPEQFSFSSGILRGHPFLGLLHIFLRHQDDFSANIKAVSEQFNKLPNALKTMVREITGSRQREEHFILYMAKLPDNEFDRVHKLLNGIQESIYNFLKVNITYDRYIGDGCNQDQKVRLYFKIRNQRNKVWVMALCVAREGSEPEPSSGDLRKVNMTATVFCMGEREARIEGKIF